MNNGQNSWNVAFRRITWLQYALATHENIECVSRHDDIVFDVTRKERANLVLLCLDEYSFGIAAARRVFLEFPEVNFVSVGGNWNGYTLEAKDACLKRNIGLYNSTELTGAIWKNEFWSYYKKDKKGNPEHPSK